LILINFLPKNNKNFFYLIKYKNYHLKVFTMNKLFLMLSLVTSVAFAAPRQELIKPVEAPVNINQAKAELGKKLFFETRLSKSGFLSCNSCHNLARGGSDNLITSIGHGWTHGPINSPTVLNSQFSVAQFWDGRAADLAEQALGPIGNPLEMASSVTEAIKVLSSIPQYKEEFQKVFNSPNIQASMIGEAIAEFEKTLVTVNAPFDKWLNGDDNAITEVQKEGYELFKSTGCIACHNGVAVGAANFQKLGLVEAYEAKNGIKAQGRFDVTGKDIDRMMFKVPTLRNVALTAPYFHDGATWDLKEAVQIMAKHQLGVNLEDAKAVKIVAFLESLTGQQPQIVYPILPPSTVNTPLPDTKK
jgi:cytochrome c peroxidase